MLRGSSKCHIAVRLVLKVVFTKVTVSGEQPASSEVVNPPFTLSGSTVILSLYTSVPQALVIVKVIG